MLRSDCVNSGEHRRGQKNRRNQKKRFAREVILRLACKQLLVLLSCVFGLSSLETMLVDSQGHDF
jgi:hypothetical protein